MKKKKGFTLIELLAVIVILAIIALIATPIVMNVIENSRKGAAERSAENYIDAVEIAIAAKRLDGPVADGEYTIDGDGNLTGNGLTEPLKIEVSGNKPTSGTIRIQDGIVVTEPTTTFTIGEYTVSYNSEGKLVASKGSATVTVYSWSTEPISLNVPIDPTDTTKFKPDPETLNKNFYLKYEVENNVVTASYVCAKFNNSETESCVRGGVNSKGNSYYNENKLFLQSLQDVGFDCNANENDYVCTDGFVHLRAYTNGNVGAYQDMDYCEARVNGSSDCGSI